MAETEREELQAIRRKALQHADEVRNDLWKRAYIRLASAADTLDAMVARIARTIDHE